MKKLKVLIIPQASKNVRGGIQRHCWNLFKLINGGSDRIEILPIPELEVVNNSLLKKPYYKSKPLHDLLLYSDYDILHVHGFISLSTIQVLRYAKKIGKKIIYSPHFHPFQFLDNPLLAKAFFYLFLKRYLKYVSHIVTISKTDMSFFSQFHNNVTSIPHHYISNELRTHVSALKRVHNRILFVGRNEKNKGIDMLCKIPYKYEVNCVTSGVRLRDDFILHNNISDEKLQSLYISSSLVVVPSRYEAFSYVALEGLIAGTPVLISDRVEIAHYLKGQPGVGIFKFGDTADFLDKLAKTVGQKVDTEAIKAIFDPDMVRNKYERIYING